MNNIEKTIDEKSLEKIREGFIDFCEFYFKDDLLIQDFISDIRYFEDKIDDKNTQKNIKEFINKFNKGK